MIFGITDAIDIPIYQTKLTKLFLKTIVIVSKSLKRS